MLNSTDPRQAQKFKVEDQLSDDKEDEGESEPSSSSGLPSEDDSDGHEGMETSMNEPEEILTPNKVVKQKSEG